MVFCSGIPASGTSPVGGVEKAGPRRAGAPRVAGFGNLPGGAQAGPIVHQRRYGAVAPGRRPGRADNRFIRPFLAPAVGAFGRAAPPAAGRSLHLRHGFRPLPGPEAVHGRNFTGRCAPTHSPVTPRVVSGLQQRLLMTTNRARSLARGLDALRNHVVKVVIQRAVVEILNQRLGLVLQGPETV